MVGQNGGGAFVLIYLFFLLVLGIPVMTIEFSLAVPAKRVLSVSISSWSLREANGTIMATLR